MALDLHKEFTRAVTMDPGGEVMDDRRVHHADDTSHEPERDAHGRWLPGGSPNPKGRAFGTQTTGKVSPTFEMMVRNLLGKISRNGGAEELEAFVDKALDRMSPSATRVVTALFKLSERASIQEETPDEPDLMTDAETEGFIQGVRERQPGGPFVGDAELEDGEGETTEDGDE